MEEKPDLSKLRNSMKFKDINSKFRNITKISFSKKSEAVPKKKKVMFLEPKEIKSRKMKKTEIILSPKLLEEKFKTEIENMDKNDFKKKLKADKLRKCHSINNNTVKMPELKSKIVNTTHYYIPMLGNNLTKTSINNNNLTKTSISKNNSLNFNKSCINLKKVKTFDNSRNKKSMEKLDNKYNMKKKKKNDKKENKKGINSKNSEKNIKYEKKEENIKIKQILEDNHHKFNLNNNTGSLVKKRSLSKCENSSNTCINENKDEENNEEIKEQINDKNNNDNLTNKANEHKHNNSVDSSKKEKKNNDNIFKKFFCCLYG